MHLIANPNVVSISAPSSNLTIQWVIIVTSVCVSRVCLKIIKMLRQLVIFLSCIFVVFAQECRFVPVCDDSGPSGGSASILKGIKGAQGMPGKAGPQGPAGLSVKGNKGDPGDCNATLISLMAKLEGKMSN